MLQGSPFVSIRAKTSFLDSFIRMIFLALLAQGEEARVANEVENRGWGLLDRLLCFPEFIIREVCQGSEHGEGNQPRTSGDPSLLLT